MKNLLNFGHAKAARKMQFIRSFEMEDFQIQYEGELGDTALTVKDHPTIEFKPNRNKDENKLKIQQQEKLGLMVNKALL